MINVCVPVLRRYDLLRRLVVSLRGSLIAPTKLFVIDNGKQQDLLLQAIAASPCPVGLHTPVRPLSVAESWNWFLRRVPEERVIANDDIVFSPESLSRLTASKADLVWAAGVGFSCFVLRDSCLEKIGLFDEEISPGYAYYEDEDYLQRLDGRGTRAPSATAENVDALVRHEHSATLKAATQEEIEEHHRKFKIAQANYAKKWGLEAAFGL